MVCLGHKQLGCTTSSLINCSKIGHSIWSIFTYLCNPNKKYSFVFSQQTNILLFTSFKIDRPNVFCLDRPFFNGGVPSNNTTQNQPKSACKANQLISGKLCSLPVIMSCLNSMLLQLKLWYIVVLRTSTCLYTVWCAEQGLWNTDSQSNQVAILPALLHALGLSDLVVDCVFFFPRFLGEGVKWLLKIWDQRL